MAGEEFEIPPKLWYQFKDWFTRQDELLELLIKVSKKQLEVLEAIVIPPPLPLGTVNIGSISPSVLERLVKTPLPVHAHPTGKIRRKGVLATLTTSYQELVKYKPDKDMLFNLAKITVSCAEDIIAQVFWGDEEITIPYYMSSKFPLTDFFIPISRRYDGREIIGDGTTEIKLKVKIPTGGTSAECNGEIAGDET